ncbi:MAG TPA: acyloxyacyl hydrolase [Sphingomicrobium sp.]|jgi:hypothetical protein
MFRPLLIASAILAAAPADAQELFGGVFIHGVDTPLTLGGDPENGLDLQLGVRARSIGTIFGRPIQPYAFGALNTAGKTSFVAAGVSTKFGDRVYVRPGIGLALHNGLTEQFDNPFNRRVEFGSRLLFEPEVAVGVRINPRLTAEASLVHLSHGTLFGGQNPGIDTIGVRLNLGL